MGDSRVTVLYPQCDRFTFSTHRVDFASKIGPQCDVDFSFDRKSFIKATSVTRALKTHGVDAVEVVACGRVHSKRLPYLFTTPRHFFRTKGNDFGVVLNVSTDIFTGFDNSLSSDNTLEYVQVSLSICDADLALVAETVDDEQKEKSEIQQTKVFKKRDLHPAEIPDLSAEYVEFFGYYMNTHYSVEVRDQEMEELSRELRELYHGPENSRDELWRRAKSPNAKKDFRSAPLECHLQTLREMLLREFQQEATPQTIEKEEGTDN